MIEAYLVWILCASGFGLLSLVAGVFFRRKYGDERI